MRIAACFSIFLTLALSSSPALADAALTPHAAEYKVKISVLSGRLSTRLTRTEKGYEAVHIIEPTGLARMMTRGTIEETSRFNTSADGVVPVHYTSQDTLSKEESDADIAFDWDTGAIGGIVDGQPISGVLADIAHDRVSIQYELMHDLKNGGASGQYTLFDVDELKVLNVTLIGSRDFKVPAGRYTAIGVQHQAEGSSRVTTLWCVPELDYLPIIIEQHRNGKLRLRATLAEYSVLPG